MKERYLKNLERRLVLKYTFIVLALSLGGATILYIFDNVLNGIVIDFLKVLLIDSDPLLALCLFIFYAESCQTIFAC